jgi:hypothetical protein
MRNSKIYVGLIGLLIVLGIIALLPLGCATEKNDPYPDPRNEPYTANFLVSGTITQIDGITPVANATCTLQSAGRADIAPVTAYTNGGGVYTMPQIPSGSYTLRVSAGSFINSTLGVTVAGADTTANAPLLSLVTWSAFVGNSTMPYDANSAYALVYAVDTSSQPLATTAIDFVPNSYLNRGYIKTSSTVDWTAQSTYSNGSAFFYKLTPNQTYSVTALKSGYTFPSLVGMKPSTGEVSIYTIQGAAGGPTLTPTPTRDFSGSSSGSPSGKYRVAMGLALMLALSCLVLLKKK